MGRKKTIYQFRGFRCTVVVRRTRHANKEWGFYNRAYIQYEDDDGNPIYPTTSQAPDSLGVAAFHKEAKPVGSRMIYPIY